MNFYKRYPGDYMRDTGHLTLMEHGAYSVLLDHYYSSHKPLSSSWAALHRLCRATTPAERAAVTAVVEQFFVLQDDNLYHSLRADKEILKWAAKAEHNRMVGKLGGRPRNNPDGNPDGFQTVTQKKPSPDLRERNDLNSRGGAEKNRARIDGIVKPLAQSKKV